MPAVSEFQTAGAEQRKARSAKLVLVVGLQILNKNRKDMAVKIDISHKWHWCNVIVGCYLTVLGHCR